MFLLHLYPPSIILIRFLILGQAGYDGQQTDYAAGQRTVRPLRGPHAGHVRQGSAQHLSCEERTVMHVQSIYM
jgi:hypothetical protein